MNFTKLMTDFVILISLETVANDNNSHARENNELAITSEVPSAPITSYLCPITDPEIFETLKPLIVSPSPEKLAYTVSASR